MSSETPLLIENLRKSYTNPKGQQFEAVKGISLEVKKGEIFALLGPNGAGKTTMISAITTLEKPSSGHVKVFGVDVQENPRLTKSDLGVVHQEIINTGFFSVQEILEFQSGYYGVKKNKERLDYLMQKLALYEHRDKKVKQLSGGMKRRLMIAKALVHHPRLLLLDEPTAGVDVGLRETLWDFVLELKKEGLTILLTTHYLEEAEELCERVGIIHKGELKALGPTRSIVAQFSQKKIALTLKSPMQFHSQYLLATNGSTYEFMVPMEMNCGDLLSQIQVSTSQIQDLKIDEGRLEDAFLKVIDGGLQS